MLFSDWSLLLSLNDVIKRWPTFSPLYTMINMNKICSYYNYYLSWPELNLSFVSRLFFLFNFLLIKNFEKRSKTNKRETQIGQLYRSLQILFNNTFTAPLMIYPI
uniref:Uncharacterized protein n=1 Tax=Cacopsylla melanoneura TaxID=428564 RepID=A0A8D8YRK9_9HEMI